ncbi:unnamed protein product, partial [marine sediment metagenome]
PSFSGNGDEINVTLQQSYLNNSFNMALSPSDSNNNSFSLPCPTDLTFNSSFTNITIENIYAPNKTLTVEDDLGVEVIGAINYHYISFEAKGVGYIENITLHIRETNAAQITQLSLYLYNATNDAGNIRPDSQIYVTPIVDDEEIAGTTFFWHKMSGIHKLINCSNTYMNTFFLNLEKSGGGPTT